MPLLQISIGIVITFGLVRWHTKLEREGDLAGYLCKIFRMNAPRWMAPAYFYGARAAIGFPALVGVLAPELFALAAGALLADVVSTHLVGWLLAGTKSPGHETIGWYLLASAVCAGLALQAGAWGWQPFLIGVAEFVGLWVVQSVVKAYYLASA